MTDNEKFEFLEHTADIKIKVYGSTLNEIFENIALAFSHYISKENIISPSIGKIITVSGHDKESLLYNFIDELIYLLDAQHFIVSKAKVQIRGYNLRAEVYGEDSNKYKGLDHIKAATYSDMYIKKILNKEEKEHWEAQMVFDV